MGKYRALVSVVSGLLVVVGLSGVPAQGQTSKTALPAAGRAAVVPGASTGYWLAGSDGAVFSFGAAAHGSAVGTALASPIVGMASTSTGGGYWLVASDGGVFTFGDAGFHGSMGGMALNKPIVGMASTSTGDGYWLVASDGGIFSFGDATFHGSMGGVALNKPIVGMASTTSDGGYWLVASDGGIFSFGTAGFHGSTGDVVLNKPVVGMASTALNGGYWLVASDGGIFSFGDAGFHGSMGGGALNKPIVGMASTALDGGYWLVASDGGIFNFGNAGFSGSLGGKPLAAPIVGMSRNLGPSRLPVVTSLTPSVGPAAGGTSVTIAGTDLSSTTSVNFGTDGATNVVNVSDTQVTATSPAGSGTEDVTVTTPAGTSAVSSGDSFEYGGVGTQGLPDAPTAVKALDGSCKVTLTPPARSGSSPIRSYTLTASPGLYTSTLEVVPSESAVLIDLPSGMLFDTYTYTAHATNATGNGAESAPSAPQNITGLCGLLPPAPTVTLVSPARGPQAGGTPVTITGTGFTGLVAVSFGGADLIPASAVSDTTLLTTSPVGTGTVDVVVPGLGNKSAVTLGDKFTYDVPPNTPPTPEKPGLTVALCMATVTVTPGTGNDSAATVSYTASVSGGFSGSVSGPTFSNPILIPVPGLTPNQPYTVTVHASNGANNSLESTKSDLVSTGSCRSSL